MSASIKNFLLMPIRDLVLFPSVVVPVFVGRDRSIEAVNIAVEDDTLIFVSTQKDISVDAPKLKDMYLHGCLCRVVQILKMADGTVKILIEGVKRGKIVSYAHDKLFSTVEVEEVEDIPLSKQQEGVYRKSMESKLLKYSRVSDVITDDVVHSLRNVDSLGTLADLVTVHMPISIESKQTVLAAASIEERVEQVLALIDAEIEWLKIDQRIQSRVKERIANDQKDYVRKEKLKALKDELGEGGGDPFEGEFNQLVHKIKSAKMPKEANEKVMGELNKLKYMSFMSAEASVIRNYIDNMLEIPWKKMTKLKNDLNHASNILDQDHYGLEKVKERILEALAVQSRVNKVRGSILCLVGPPGVGKTSLGKSIADSMGRQFVRISLGGVRDEAEIRGHRKTYIGAMPGRIIKALKKAKSMNPLIMLDELDKMGMDYRGDPAAALLEVLDPSQNDSFVDNYVEVPCDMSNVMFMTTANSLDIPDALVDRMEIIPVSGYTEDEKLNIARKHLLLKVMQQNGLEKNELSLSDRVLVHIIRHYTREAGVRELERCLDKISRKIVRKIMTPNETQVKQPKALSIKAVEDLLGVEKHDVGLMHKKHQIGVVQGLSWTPSGGDLLTIESLIMPGKGDLVFTGSLGDVMQESIQASMSLIRQRTSKIKLVKDYYSKNDFHIHVPEGATPKDGPSAGVSVCTAIISSVTKISVRKDVAMTGEITLRGEVLPIGGLKEKLLAAVRGGIHTVIIPHENAKDIKEIDKQALGDLNIVCVKTIEEVFEHALTKRLPL
ncbi:MAG TPA: endopeptidase La [Gammaproteobacteria bacterium]|nr:endopeptidase La [Gammaproteobacteria bacterium]